MMLSSSNVTSGSPAELVIVNIDAHSLLVDALDLVSISEVPFTLALGLVVVELALEEGVVGVDPLSGDHLSLAPFTDKLLASLEENEGATAFLLALDPGTRVHVLVVVLHHTFAVAFTIGPVAVVHTDTGVHLFADAALHVIGPGALVFGFLLFFFDAFAHSSESIGAFSTTASFNKVSAVNITVGVSGDTFASVVTRGLQSLTA